MSDLEPSYVSGNVNRLMRAEGLAIFIFGLIAYEFLGFQWGFFILVFFVPDIALLAYFVNAKVGAIAYNISHSYILPLMLFAYGFFVSSSAADKLAIIWVAHIGFDRALGYGLKYARGFRYTHLGKIGRDKAH
jgi:hypothetical protein